LYSVVLIALALLTWRRGLCCAIRHGSAKLQINRKSIFYIAMRERFQAAVYCQEDHILCVKLTRGELASPVARAPHRLDAAKSATCILRYCELRHRQIGRVQELALLAGLTVQEIARCQII